jgi:hypothetical protein
MAYYCEDCQRKVNSVASAIVHRRFGHNVSLLEPSPPSREERERIAVESIRKLHFHHEMPFELGPMCRPTPRSAETQRSIGRPVS